MSLQREKSDSAEADETDDLRPPRFSFGDSSSEPDSVSSCLGGADRVCRGMLAGLRDSCEGRILTVLAGLG